MSSPNHTHNTREQQLLMRFHSTGDPRILGDLLEPYTAFLFGVAKRYVQDDERAKDIVQTVFEKAIAEIPKKEINVLGAWLYQVTKNECLSVFRAKKHLREESALLDLGAAEPLSIADLLIEEQKKEELMFALDDLKTDQRESLYAFYFEKLSYQQIAERRQSSIKQVKSDIQNGKRNLRIKLIERKPEWFQQ